MTIDTAATQDDIEARLAAINAAVAVRTQSDDSVEAEAARMEAMFGSAQDGCPIDPQEYLQCEGCQ